MTLKTQLESDMAVFFSDDEFAETVTYDDEEITAVIDRNISAGDLPEGYIGDFAYLYAKVSDISAPTRRTEVVVNSETWVVFDDQKRIRPRLEGDRLVWKIPVSKDEKPKVW